MNQEVMMLTGAGQIGMAIARRVGYGKKIVIGDKRMESAENISGIMNQAGFDTVPVEMDLSSRESILNLIAEARKYSQSGFDRDDFKSRLVRYGRFTGRGWESDRAGRRGGYDFQSVRAPDASAVGTGG